MSLRRDFLENFIFNLKPFPDRRIFCYNLFIIGSAFLKKVDGIQPLRYYRFTCSINSADRRLLPSCRPYHSLPPPTSIDDWNRSLIPYLHASRLAGWDIDLVTDGCDKNKHQSNLFCFQLSPRYEGTCIWWYRNLADITGVRLASIRRRHHLRCCCFSFGLHFLFTVWCVKTFTLRDFFELRSFQSYRLLSGIIPINQGYAQSLPRYDEFWSGPSSLTIAEGDDFGSITYVDYHHRGSTGNLSY